MTLHRFAATAVIAALAMPAHGQDAKTTFEQDAARLAPCGTGPTTMPIKSMSRGD